MSQSGETADTLGALREVQIKGGEAMGVVNVVGSSIARQCGHGVHSLRSWRWQWPRQRRSAIWSRRSTCSRFSLRARTLAPHEGRAFAEELMGVPDLVEAYLATEINVDPIVEWVRECRSVLFMGRGSRRLWPQKVL